MKFIVDDAQFQLHKILVKFLGTFLAPFDLEVLEANNLPEGS